MKVEDTLCTSQDSKTYKFLIFSGLLNRILILDLAIKRHLMLSILKREKESAFHHKDLL